MKLPMVWITSLVLAGAVALPGWAGVPEEGPLAGLRERLGLSDEQVEQAEKFRAEHRAAARERRAETRALREELRALLETPTLDGAAVRAKGQRLAELKAAAVRAQVEARLALRQLLTPEQQERLRDVRRERGRRGGRRWERSSDPGAADAAQPPSGR